MIRGVTVAMIMAASFPAFSQTAGPINVFGAIAQVVPTSISVTTDNNTETFTLAQNLLVIEAKKVTLADIQPNDFVASAASRGVDGRLHALEVRIFPEALRGTGEGQRPMDEAGTRTMTNATVAGTAISGGSNRLTVRFPGGESELVVNPGVPVVRMVAVDRAVLQPGMRVRVQGARGVDGATASRITITE